MELKIWQELHNISNKELAKKVGCHESMVCHYHANRKNFSPELAYKISKATKGEVAVMDILFSSGKVRKLTGKNAA